MANNWTRDTDILDSSKMDKIRNDFLILSTKIQENISQPNVEEMSSLLRELRTLCASNEDVRNTIFDSIIELKSFRHLFEVLLNSGSAIGTMQCVKIGLQVIGNTVVQNQVKCVEHVWNVFEHFLLKCFHHNDEKLNIIVMMILFNIYKSVPRIALQSSVRASILDQSIVGNEFAIFFLEELLYSNNSSENTKIGPLFESLSQTHQLFVLEYAKVNVKPGVDIEYFVQMFNRDAFRIISDVADVNDVQITVLCLELLAEYSASDLYQKMLQDNATFVSNVFQFLKTMHLLGKEVQGHRFAPDQNLSNLFAPSQENGAIFGLKATCVKLVANLCWSHAQNQDLVRVAECFPVLLECCNLDAKNPLIKEWAVFAIRNCCQNNLANQHLVASLNRESEYCVDPGLGLTLAPGVNIGTLNKASKPDKSSGQS